MDHPFWCNEHALSCLLEIQVDVYVHVDDRHVEVNDVVDADTVHDVDVAVNDIDGNANEI